MQNRRTLHRRHKKRGGVLFIVAMTLAVLASLGIYALRATATEVALSGNARQATQTHYLAEYATLGAANHMSATNAMLYLTMMQNNPDAKCTSLYGVPTSASLVSRACRRVGAYRSTDVNRGEIGSSWAVEPLASYGGTHANPGSLGPMPVEPDFFVEVTDPGPAPQPPGFGRNSNSTPLCYRQFTVTAVGMTHPKVTSNPTAQYGGMGMETARSRLVAGPAPCGGT